MSDLGKLHIIPAVPFGSSKKNICRVCGAVKGKLGKWDRYVSELKHYNTKTADEGLLTLCLKRRVP